MNNSKHMEKITLHLQQRFAERHNVTLTKNRRMMLRQQIKNGVGKLLSIQKNKKLYRVFLYNNDKMCNVSYVIMYCPLKDRILTVLPKQDSEEYVEFVKTNRLSMDMVTGREMTARERTALSVKTYLDNKKQSDKKMVLDEGLRRLQAYRNSRRFFKKRVDIYSGM